MTFKNCNEAIELSPGSERIQDLPAIPRDSARDSSQMSNLQILVISLLRSPGRRAKVVHELSRIPQSWEFLDAVDGTAFTPSKSEYDKDKVIRLLGFELTKNEIGCFLSHQKGWLKCVEGNRPTLIFEDDFVINENFRDALDIVLNKFTSWDIFRLQALAESNYTEIAGFGNNKVVINHSDPIGAAAYIVTPSSAKILLDKSAQIFEPLDHFLEHKQFHGLQVCALIPYPVGVSGDGSTIADRPARKAVKGYKKFKRSIFRILDRLSNANPWFGA
jgi:glycosyl transferase, family 25